MYFTGVGSRKTPRPMGAILSDYAAVLGAAGYIGRSGAAEGADTDIEAGLDRVRAKKEIYLHRKGASGHPSQLFGVTQEAFDIAKTLHPVWESLTETAKKLHGRNVYQVLGRALNRPSQLLICWTPDGMESARERTRNSGGTATAIALAERHQIPVFNLAKPGSLTRLNTFLREKGITPPPHVEAPVLKQAGLF